MTTALLLTEIQNDYFPGGRMPLERSTDASLNAQEVLKFYRSKHLPVIHLPHISTRPDAVHFLPCTKGIEVHQNVQPLKNEMVIKKHYPNSFKDTALLNHLIKQQINHLVIVGMMTQMSIDATVRAAYDLGFTSTVLHDACAAKSLEFNGVTIPAQSVHSAFLAALQPTYASVLSVRDFLYKSGARMTISV